LREFDDGAVANGTHIGDSGLIRDDRILAHGFGWSDLRQHLRAALNGELNLQSPANDEKQTAGGVALREQQLTPLQLSPLQFRFDPPQVVGG
jgi:hypothetical protein